MPSLQGSDKISKIQSRPVIYDYRSVSEFVREMLLWKKEVNPKYSIRKQLLHSQVLSVSLVSHIASGKRRLTRDRVMALSELLGLSRAETVFLDEWVLVDRGLVGETAEAGGALRKKEPRRRVDNHILSDWLNLYIRDAAELPDFKPDAKFLFRRLGGLASVQRIERSLRFLLREGYLRKDLGGRVVPNEKVLVTTDGVPHKKIAEFHKKSLDVAKKAMDSYPFDRRRASMVMLALDDQGVTDVQELLKEFYEKLLVYLDQKPQRGDQLYQVLLHMFPIGGKNEH